MLTFTQDISEAYSFLDVDPDASEQFILDRFRSRYDDTGPSMRPHMRMMLERIGRTRQSQRLIDAANESESCTPYLRQANYGTNADSS